MGGTYTSSRRSSMIRSGELGWYPSSHEQQEYLSTERRCSSTSHKNVVLKCASEIRLQREKEVLQQVEGNACIRQLIDFAKEPPCLVMEHLQDDALKSSSKSKLSRKSIKFIARSILSALGSLHAKGIAHTGNIISNCRRKKHLTEF